MGRMKRFALNVFLFLGFISVIYFVIFISEVYNLSIYISLILIGLSAIGWNWLNNLSKPHNSPKRKDKSR